MTKIQAAVGTVQLRRLEEMLRERIKRGRERTQMLADVPELTLPPEPEGYRHVYYLHSCLVPPEWAGRKRDLLMKVLQERFGVGSKVLNPPTYQLKTYIRKHTEGQSLPLSEEIGDRLFCPSIHPLMTHEDNAYVAAAISEAVELVKSGQVPEE